MKLTKLQRHTAYIILLHEAEQLRSFRYGFCDLILIHFRIDNSGFGMKDVMYDKVTKFFPELHSKKPRVVLFHWFQLSKEGWEKRIALLKQCIEETY